MARGDRRSSSNGSIGWSGFRISLPLIMRQCCSAGVPFGKHFRERVRMRRDNNAAVICSSAEDLG